MAYQVSLTMKSRNVKTGPIPVSTTASKTCPTTCPFRGNGCYAELGHVAMQWRKVDDGRAGVNWDAFVSAVADMPEGTFWRHNQAGDLPSDGRTIDAASLAQLVTANAGRRGFTYTHHDMSDENNRAAVADANARGFTVNLSGNNLADADLLADMAIGPVVVVLDQDATPQDEIRTPSGRKVVVCPATYRDDVSCATCQLCQRQRASIVGFPAHGVSKAKASKIAKGN